MDGEVGAFREVLSQKTVGVLISAALPRAVQVAEVDLEIGGQRQALVIGKFFAVVPGQRAPQFSGQMLNLCRQRCDDGLRFLSAHLSQHNIARAPFDQRRNEAVLRTSDQVAFPMAGDRAVLDSGGPFPDRDRVFDLTETVSLQARVPKPADGACRPQMRKQLLLQNATGLNEQASVDRFVRHACALVIGMLTLQPARDLLG